MGSSESKSLHLENIQAIKNGDYSAKLGYGRAVDFMQDISTASGYILICMTNSGTGPWSIYLTKKGLPNMKVYSSHSRPQVVDLKNSVLKYLDKFGPDSIEDIFPGSGKYYTSHFSL